MEFTFQENHKFLSSQFPLVSPMEFYHGIFGQNLEKKQQQQGKPNGILTVVGQKNSLNELVFDGLDAVKAHQGEDFIVMAPIGYYGRRKNAQNARYLFAMAIDVDGVGSRQLEGYFYYTGRGILPRPTYVVNSGHGVHLYFQFIKPLRLYPNHQEKINIFKHYLTDRVWNLRTSTLTKPIEKQYQTIFQSFRIPGTKTKNPAFFVEVFRTGDCIEIDYLNKFIDEKYRIDFHHYSPVTPLEEAKKKWPDWWANKIANKSPKGIWKVKRNLYDWWKQKSFSDEVTLGHRYHCLMTLFVFGIKCHIDQKEVEKDAEKLFLYLSSDKFSEPFLRKDFLDAKRIYQSRFARYGRASLEEKTGIAMPPNKRNYRSQELHLKIARATRDIIYENWRKNNGRKPKKEIVLRWKKYNPDGRKVDCINETGLDKKTVYKWWNYKEPEQ